VLTKHSHAVHFSPTICTSNAVVAVLPRATTGYACCQHHRNTMCTRDFMHGFSARTWTWAYANCFMPGTHGRICHDSTKNSCTTIVSTGKRTSQSPSRPWLCPTALHHTCTDNPLFSIAQPPCVCGWGPLSAPSQQLPIIVLHQLHSMSLESLQYRWWQGTSTLQWGETFGSLPEQQRKNAIPYSQMTR
jgi:hypothetical protein